MNPWRCNRSPLFGHIREQEEERRSTHRLLLPKILQNLSCHCQLSELGLRNYVPFENHWGGIVP